MACFLAKCTFIELENESIPKGYTVLFANSNIDNIAEGSQLGKDENFVRQKLGLSSAGCFR